MMIKKYKHLTVVVAVIAGIIILFLVIVFFIFNRDKSILLPKLYESTGISYEKTQTRAQELRVATTDISGLFNPSFSVTQGDQVVTSFVFEPFMKKDGLGNYEPCTVKEAEISEDGMNMKLVVQDNLKFSDGSNVTTFDVAASIIAMALSDTEQISEIYDFIKGIDDFRNGTSVFPEGIQIEDDKSLTIEFSQASANNLCILDTLLQKGSFVKISEDDKQADASEAKDLLNNISRSGIGTGAYQFVETAETANPVELVYNAEYRDKIRDIEKILVYHTTYSEIVGGLEMTNNKGEDLYDIYCWENSPGLLTATKNNQGYDIYMKPNESVYGLFFNEDNSEFSDSRLREAMALAIRENIEEGDFISENFSGFMIPSLNLDVYQLCEESTEKGVHFLAEENWSVHESRQASKQIEELSSEGTKSLSYDLPIIENNEVQTSLANEIAEILGACGITVNVIPKSMEEYQSDCIMGTDYDILLSSVVLNDTVSGITELYEDYSSITKPIVTDKQLEALADYEKAFEENTQKELKETFFDVLEEEVPFIPLARTTKLIAISSDLKGFSLSKDMVLIGDIEKVYR